MLLEECIIIIVVYRSMDVQKPVFVIFLVGMPWVIVTSPEFVKVCWVECLHATLYSCVNNYSYYLQEVAMKPLHDKPKSFWKDFQILFGER